MKNRLQSLDIFRGITIAFMIIVNTAGGSPSFAPLQHAAWHGFTPTDLVFPSFVFITGVSSWFSYKQYNHIFGHPLSTWRILGVLQRIALCYGMGSVLCLILNTKQIVGLSVILLLTYWAILLGFGDLTMAGNAGQKLDLWLFGEGHLYHGEGIAFDPEGLLSTIPALVTFLIGYLVGGFIGQTQDKMLIIKQLALWSIILITAALIWNLVFPINKKLWTSSYVLLAGGLSMSIFTLCYYIVDVKGIQNWGKFFKIFGTNAILGYMVSELLITILFMIQTTDASGKTINAQEAIYNTLFVSWAGKTEIASFLFALTYMLFCWAIVWLFYRKNIFLKV
jgi:predicted acyltransferase